MRWTAGAVRAALGLPPPAGSLSGQEEPSYSGISTDSRAVRAGDLFDGHDFLVAAAAAGAGGAVVGRDTRPVAGLALYRVDDTLRALGMLARSRRRTVPGPVVAITGTNGKTSTKEMAAAVLRTRYRVHATRANLNNLVGVPLTILEAPDQVEAMVVEAGANQPGEVPRYREIIAPDITIVTNVAPGHLEGFGSLEGVLREKLALVQGVPLAIVGPEPAALGARARELAGRVITAGIRDAELMPAQVELDQGGRPRLTVGGMSFTLGLLGAHQAQNAMLAWALAEALRLDLGAAAAALEQCSVPGARGELTQRGGLTILNDSYNANPASFQAAIDLTAALRRGRRLAFVAGTMRELGPDAAAHHAAIADRLVALEPDLLAAVGEFVPALEPYRARLGPRLLTAPDAESMGPLLAQRLRGDELVVLKGSRGLALERILPAIIDRVPRTV